MNVVGPILHFGKTRPEAPALIEGSQVTTYRELARLVRRTACHMTKCGLSHGDRIGLCLKDNSEHIIALLAVAHIGGVAVPLDWRARPAENGRFVDALGLKCVLAEPDSVPARECEILPLDENWHRALQQA